MQMQTVTSSNIAAIGHNADTSTLRITFNSGTSYDYQNIPESLFRELLVAESVGSFFTRNIKSQPEVYPYTKVS